MMNITEKILAKAAGEKAVSPGEIVDAQVDIVMIHDLTGPLTVDAFRRIGVDHVWDSQKIVMVLDHQVPLNLSRQRSCIRPCAGSLENSESESTT